MEIEVELMIQQLRSVIASGGSPRQIAIAFTALLLEAGIATDDMLAVGKAIIEQVQ